ncbi:MAG: zinc ABC transporter substrate-binding protein [Planctomycetaceae bacterium]|nr:zinc ABC transporter substrate-binding protein [Planctomycetaceae bacterium]
MMSRNKKLIAAIIALDVVLTIIIVYAFFLGDSDVVDDGRLRVVVGIDPQACFVERIGGDRVSVEVLVPAGKEPETYSPTPEKIRRLARSHVFFRVGFPMEATLLPKLESVAPKLKIVDTRANLDLFPADSHTHEDDAHAHSPGCDCGMDGIDPHVWVSPALVKRQAETIRDTLISLDPDGKAEYESNCELFLADLTELQVEIREKLAPFRGKTIYVYHPTYAYFCDEFGLEQKAIEVDGKPPSPKTLAEWIGQARTDEVRIIFVQPEFNRSVAETAAGQIGAKLVTHSTLNRDYFQSMRDLASLISQAYSMSK